MRKNKNNPPRLTNAGFTLVELLITMIVLGLAIASLGGLYYVIQQSQVKAQHYDIAVRAARTEIEDLRNNGYDSLTPGSTITFTSSLPSSLPSNKTGTVAVSKPMSGLRRVDVTVTYNDYGTSESVILSSDIGIIGLGQSS